MSFHALACCLALTGQIALEQSPSSLQPGLSESQDAPLTPFGENAAPAASRPLKSVLVPSAAAEPAEPVQSVEAAAADAELAPEQAEAEAAMRGVGLSVLEQVLQPPAEGALTGRPYSLVDVLSRSPDRTHQLWIARGYWKLAVATADYHLAIAERARLDAVPIAEGAAASPLWQTARYSAEARIRETEIAAVAAQHELADLIHMPPNEPLPLSIDPPHVGPYRTQFETLFATRTPPARAWLINRTLPIRRDLIEVRAEAVRSAEAATDAAQLARGGTDADLRAVIAAHETLWLQRRAFLVAVRDYNHDIAEYAMTVAQVGTSEAVLASMLIKVKSQQTIPTNRNEPTPATAGSAAEFEAAEPAEPARLEAVPKTAPIRTTPIPLRNAPSPAGN